MSLRDPSFWAFFSQEDLEKMEPLAQGGSGYIYKAINKTEGVVCVKDCRCEEDYKREILFLEHCDHPNIVSLIAKLAPGVRCSMGFPIEFGYVMEYVAGGTLSKMIHSTEKYSKYTTYNLMAQVARGLKEIHSNGIIHRDIKPLNILVESTRLTAKLADMGISKTLLETKTGERRTNIYAPPEIFASDEIVYDNTYDIYSFAISLWEVIHRRQPFSEICKNNVDTFVLNGGRPQIDDNLTPPTIRELLESCWSKNPLDRWSIDRIISFLEEEKARSRSPHIITPTEVEESQKLMRISYSSAEDVYYRGDEFICDWESLCSSVLHVQRRVDDDDKMAYLARAPGTDTGAIMWSIDLTRVQPKSIKINFFNAAIFDETAELAISVRGEGIERFIEHTDIAMKETEICIDNPEPTMLTITAIFSSGCNFISSQLFRTNLTQREAVDFIVVEFE